MLRIPFYMSVNSFRNKRIFPKSLSIGCELRSKLMKFRESSEDMRLSSITLEFDTQLFSLNRKFEDEKWMSELI